MDGAATFGFVPQRFSLYEDLSVDENLAAAREALRRRRTTSAAPRTADLLERVGMDRFRARLAGALSGGMKQKLALVAALLTQPPLLLLDEPTTGVDPVSRREFWMLLNQLHHEGLTIVVSTPYMDEAEYATRIAFLDRGRISSRGHAPGDPGLVRAGRCSRSAPRTACRCAQLLGRDAGGRRPLAVRHRPPRARGRRHRARAAASACARRCAGVVAPEDVQPVAPSLEDVFVLAGEDEEAA